MNRINYRRVVGGGLLAGAVLAIGEILLATLLQDRLRAAMDAFGTAPFTPRTMVLYVVALFVLGMALIWLYAALRPRFGPGPRTAVRAGLTVWFLVWLWCFASMAMIWGLFAGDIVGIVLVWGLVEVILAALAGSWLYREDSQAAGVVSGV